MKLFVFTLIALIAIASAAKCSSGEQPVEISGKAGSCAWYAKNSCCPVQGINTPLAARNNWFHDSTFPPAYTCDKPNIKCAEMDNLLQCSPCSDKSGEFTDSGTGNLALCTSFSDDFWAACKNEKMYVLADNDCQKIADVFADQDAFVASRAAAVGYTGVNKKDSDCFSAGSIARPSALLAIAASAVAFQTRSPLAMTLIILAIVSLSSAKCTGGGDASKVDFQCACAWYKGDTCCPTKNGSPDPFTGKVGELCARSGAKKYSTCDFISTKCRDAVDMLNCAIECSPKQQEMFNGSSSSWMICKDQADKIYDACKDDQWFSTTDNKCIKFSADAATDSVDKFFSGTGLIAAGSLEISTSSDCWNSAPSVTVSFMALVAILGYFI